MSVGFVIKGKKRDIIVLGETLQEAEKEFEKHKKDIEKFSIELDTEPSQSKKINREKVSIYQHVLGLKDEGFLNTPKSLKDIKEKLADKTYHYPVTSLTNPIKRLIRSGEIGRIKKNNVWHYVKR